MVKYSTVHCWNSHCGVRNKRQEKTKRARCIAGKRCSVAFGSIYFCTFAAMEKYQFKDLILFEDEDYIVINKPSGIATLDDRNIASITSILEMAREYCATAQVCHRLDKETSGALAIAKNPVAYRGLSMQFENRTVKKVYHAVCDGIHDFKDSKITAPISTLSKGAVKIDPYQGKPAEATVNTVRAYKIHTLVACEPLTGRMHQIRIHLSSVSAPISGDEQYKGQKVFLSKVKRRFNLKKDTEEQPLIKRVALHASGLGFRSTNNEKNITIEAPYPKDFAVLLKQLDKNSR